jgi:hypothetical protein
LWREHAPLIVLVAAYTAARFIVWRWTGAEALGPQPADPMRVFYWPLLGLGFLVFMTFHLFRLTFVDRETGGLLKAETWQKFGREYLFSYRGACAVLVLLLYTLLSHTFGAFKRAIPALQPFYLDPWLVAADRKLHFGHDPWRILHPLLAHPPITIALQNLYTFGWFIPLAGLLFLVAWSGDRAFRLQVLLTLVLAWILLGTVLAVAFSSVGPCFYQLLTGNDYYAPLMAYLRDVGAHYDLPALSVQEMLWNGHLRGGLGELGISAMPSMHLAMSSLVALTAWKANRWLGVVMSIVTCLILLGSIHLAWHYAVDGYFSIVAILLLWSACGIFARRWTAAATAV